MQEGRVCTGARRRQRERFVCIVDFWVAVVPGARHMRSVESFLLIRITVALRCHTVYAVRGGYRDWCACAAVR